MSTEQMLGAWGAYDRDDPFPLFEDVCLVVLRGVEDGVDEFIAELRRQFFQ